MNLPVTEEINQYISSVPEPKRGEMIRIQELVRQVLPDGKLWFESGKNSEDKTVSNPTIGYGAYIIHYANGTSREFFQIGLSANTTGISVYIMGIKDKTYLLRTFGDSIGKATVTGYCIKFKTIQGIHLEVLEAALRSGLALTTPAR